MLNTHNTPFKTASVSYNDRPRPSFTLLGRNCGSTNAQWALARSIPLVYPIPHNLRLSKDLHVFVK